MSTTITLVHDEGTLDASHRLRNNTALLYCTRIEGGERIVKEWPRLSSGEEVLWSVLGWLNGVCDLPDAETLAACLDTANLAVVTAVVAEARQVAS